MPNFLAIVSPINKYNGRFLQLLTTHSCKDDPVIPLIESSEVSRQLRDLVLSVRQASAGLHIQTIGFTQMLKKKWPYSIDEEKLLLLQKTCSNIFNHQNQLCFSIWLKPHCKKKSDKFTSEIGVKKFQPPPINLPSPQIS